MYGCTEDDKQAFPTQIYGTVFVRQKCMQTLVIKPEGKEPTCIPKQTYDNNIKMDFRGTGVRMWTEFIQLR